MKTSNKKVKTSNKEKEVKETKTVKNPTNVSKSENDSKTIKDTVKKTVTQTREVKYKYPTNVNTTDEKKKWRQQTRIKDANFNKELNEAKKKKSPKAEIDKIEKSYRAFRKERYLVP